MYEFDKEMPRVGQARRRDHANRFCNCGRRDYINRVCCAGVELNVASKSS
jgi:hypothetical protein